MHSLFLRICTCGFLSTHKWSNDSSIPTSLPSFSILQYVDQPHELLFMDLFKVDSIHSGPAYFQPTGIFEVTCPKPKKKKYKKVDQCVKPVPTTLPEEFRIIQRLLVTR